MWRRSMPDGSDVLGHRELETPSGGGFMPLFDVICWMASSGNRAPIDPESWDSCVGQLITKAESGELPIYGTASRGGRPKLLPPSDFSGVLARRVYKAGYLYLIGPADEDGPYGTK